MTPARANRGFTLVELLVVVIIGALLLVGVYEFFSAGYTAWRRTTDASETRYHAARALDEIARVLTTAYIGGSLTDFIGIDGQDPETGMAGDAVELITADGRLARADGYDLARVGYFLDQTGERGLVKIIDAYPYAHPITAETVPDPGAVLPMYGETESNEAMVVSLELKYYDGSVWLDSWDSRLDRRLPTAVTATIGVEDSRGAVLNYARTVTILGAKTPPVSPPPGDAPV